MLGLEAVVYLQFCLGLVIRRLVSISVDCSLSQLESVMIE